MHEADGRVNAYPSLSVRLREATRDVHHTAERSGVMRSFLRGRIERAPYVHLLRALHPIYAALEAGLDAHPLPIRFLGLYRTAALEADLVALHGAAWRSEVIACGAARHLAMRITACAEGRPHRLAAHAYVRYLGDLSGGAALGALVRRQLELHDGTGNAFYVFPPPDADVWKRRFRAALDATAPDDVAAADIVDEALAAFRIHIAIFEEVGADQDPAGRPREYEIT